MKRFAALSVAFLLFVSLFAGCAAQNSAKSDRPVKEIYADIEVLDVLPEMLTLDDEYIENYFGIDLSTVSEQIFSISGEVVRADMVILVRVKGDKQPVKDALELILSQKAAEMQNYLPDQYEIVKKASVEELGDLVYLVVSPERDAIVDLIQK